MGRRIWPGAALGLLLCMYPLLRASAAELEFGEGALREADLGERVSITVSLPPGNGDRVLHIAPDGGVTLDAVRAVCDGEGPVNTAYYTICRDYLTDGCAAEIHFAEWFSDVDGLELCLDVHLNENASMAENPVRFIWNGEESELRLVTHGFRLFRGIQTGNGREPRPVSGVRSCLYDEAGKKLRFSVTREGAFRLCAGENCAHSRHVSTLCTGESGLLTLEGLSAGDYTWEEIHLPRGMPISGHTVHFHLTGEGELETGDGEAGNGTLYLVEEGGVSPESPKRDSLRFYIWGIRILSAVLFLLLLFRRAILRAIG